MNGFVVPEAESRYVLEQFIEHLVGDSGASAASARGVVAATAWSTAAARVAVDAVAGGGKA